MNKSSFIKDTFVSFFDDTGNSIHAKQPASLFNQMVQNAGQSQMHINTNSYPYQLVDKELVLPII